MLLSGDLKKDAYDACMLMYDHFLFWYNLRCRTAPVGLKQGE